MRKKDVVSFAFESFFNRTISFNYSGTLITNIDYLRQVNRLNANIEIASIRYLLNQYAIDYVIDIGANRGQYYNYLREVIGFKGKVISIEPSPQDFKVLHASGQHDKDFLALNVACSDQEGTALLNVAKDTKLNSFYSGSEYASVRFEGKVDKVDQLEVNVLTLARIFCEYAIPKESKIMVKVDTQGHDVHVIKGLSDWIQNVPAIQTELSLIPVYKGISSYTDVIRYLEEIGFNLFSSTPVTRDKQDHSIIELNGFFVKRLMTTKPV